MKWCLAEIFLFLSLFFVALLIMEFGIGYLCLAVLYYFFMFYLSDNGPGCQIIMSKYNGRFV